MAFKLISEREKRKIKKSAKELKESVDGLLEDLGIKSKQNKTKTEEEIIKENQEKEAKKIGDNCFIVSYFAFNAAILCVIFAMVQFTSNNLLLGVLLLLLIPIIIILAIFICLKISKTTFKEHIDKIRKKIKKVVESDAFLITMLIIFLVAFAIVMLIIVSMVNKQN